MKKLLYGLAMGIVFLFVGCANQSMVVIPEGFFVLGDNQEGGDTTPQQNIFLSEYKIDIYEVSVKDYKKCVKKGKCNFPLEGKDFTWNNKEKKKKYPINGISWFDANSYCQYAGKRLPTEAEWERAASWFNDLKYAYPIANFTQSCLEINYTGLRVDCREEVAPFGSYQKEINGTYDMAGNLWEWVSDWYSPNQYETVIPRDPKGPSNGLLKVNRGGSYLSTYRYVKTSYRGANNPVLRSQEIGFRCVMGGENN